MSLEESTTAQASNRPSAPYDSAAERAGSNRHTANRLIQNNDVLPQPGEVIHAASFTPLQGKVKKQGYQVKPLHIVLGITLFVLASVAAYLFTAKSVYFNTEPAEAAVAVSDGIAIKIGEGYLMHAGEFKVAVTAPGYYPLEQTFAVDDRQNQIVELNLQKLPGQLTVAAAVDEAGSVELNGEAYGPLNTKLHNIPPGEYRLTINTERYLPIQDVITIEGKDIHQTHSVELQPAWADVAINTQPAGANIIIDGDVVGQTPMTAQILRGEREVAVKLPGFKTWNQTLAVKAGESITLDTVILDKADGLVMIASTPSAASITVNGDYYGQTPMEVALAPGKSYQVTLFKDGYQAAQQSVAVESGNERQLNFNLQASLGKVSIRAVPEDALLYVDGRLLGRANQELSLPAKQTNISIKKEGYADYHTTVLPRPKFSQSLPVKLKTLEQLKWEQIKPIITTSAGQQLKLFKPQDTFSMGSSRREQGRRSNETLHTVSLSRPFYLGIHEVTNGQFRKFDSQHLSGNVKGQSLDSDNYPVVNVSWQQAALYCNWLSEQEGLPAFYIVENDKVTGFNPQSNGYRMATEAEWAWTARFEKGEMLKYAWGSDLVPSKVSANIADRNAAPVAGYIQPSYDDGYVVTAPVGTFPANAKGIHDLGGNVSEWINDFYEVTTGLSQKTEADPVGPLEGAYHVIRGPSWAQGGTTELRLSFRDYGEDARNDLGFRIARFVD